MCNDFGWDKMSYKEINYSFLFPSRFPPLNILEGCFLWVRLLGFFSIILPRIKWKMFERDQM